MKVFITGCAGYIGSVLTAKLLSMGHTVVGVDNLIYHQDGAIEPHLYHKNFSFVKSYTSNSRLMANLAYNCDSIVWLSALVGEPVCKKHYKYAIETNYLDLREFFRELYVLSKNKYIVYPNTNSAYGIAPDLCSEESKINPLGIYAMTKCASEEFLEEIREPWKQKSAIFRLATVFGPSFRPRTDLMVNDFTARAYFDKKIEIYEPEFKRNFVHVEDVVDCFIWALENRPAGIFNLGNDSLNCTKIELANKIFNQVIGSPKGVTVGDGQDPDKRNYNVSSKKLRDAGFQAKRTIEEGVNGLLKMYQPNSRETVFGWSNPIQIKHAYDNS